MNDFFTFLELNQQKESSIYLYALDYGQFKLFVREKFPPFVHRSSYIKCSDNNSSHMSNKR
ncbi:hypothetical protein HZS_1624 [Henneguya salminicola]|nr:hypothetical protein HZS_1624 [Henneguya salminicola]